MKIIRGGSVLTDDGLEKADILFDEKGIQDIGRNITGSYEEINADGLTVLPGLVDVHVHLREPGQEAKETILTGTAAAAAGGYTTICPMPNVVPSPDDVESVTAYLDRIHQEAVIRVLPYGTITRGEKGHIVSDLEGMHSLGINWFSDDGTGVADDEIFRQAMRLAARTGVLIACHTEDMAYRLPGASVGSGAYADAHGWIGIPCECETAQLERDLQVLAETGGRYHACHISSAASVAALKRAKSHGLDVSAEVTPHHLLLEDTDVHGPNWKMNPPLHQHADRMALIEGLEKGTLDFIASDHAPHTEQEKHQPMAKAPFGIVGLETAFSLLYTEFVSGTGRWTLAQLVDWMSARPAERFGMERTGRLRPGYRADIMLADLNHEYVIDAARFRSKGRNTPFNGWTVKAKVMATIAGGRMVWKESI